MKKILWTGALLLGLTSFLTAQDTWVVAAPKTVSSIPILELQGKTIAGKKIQVVTFEDHALALTQLLQGKTQILTTGFSQGYYNYKDNGGLRHLGTLVWGVSSLITKDPTVHSLEALAGKNLYVPFAKSPLDLQLQALLKSKKIQAKIAYAPIPQQVALLLQGKASFISVPEPLASRLVLEQGAFEVFSYQDPWAQVTQDPRSPQVSFFASQKFTEAQAPQVRLFLKELQTVLADLKKNPDVAAEKYAPVLGFSVPVVKRALGKTLLELPDLATTKKLIRTYLDLTGDSSPLPAELFFE